MSSLSNRAIFIVMGCLFLSAIALGQSAGIRVIEEEAIPFSGFLSKADFDQRFPGTIVSDLSTIDAGWYVIYEHESAAYYFGPIFLESTGQDYFQQLEAIVSRAVAVRPSIEGFRLELSYEPQLPASSRSTTINNSPNYGGVGNPQPAPKPSIFDFFKRLFGFG